MDPDDIIYLDSTDQSSPEVTPIYLSDTSPEVTICLDTLEVSPQKPEAAGSAPSTSSNR